ncbi:MAG: GNAT family N-acetyltransferase [Desulfamplus sp.]|nr:GNAT family N-acetyltransferase [Desulfamplus sp.]
MTTLKLHSMFNPEAVAVVGASDKPGTVGASIMKNIVYGGFKGKIFPVNPEYKEIMGFKCFPDVAAIYADKGDLEIKAADAFPVKDNSTGSGDTQSGSGDNITEICGSTSEKSGAARSPVETIAVIATPLDTVSGVVEACGMASMAGAVLISSSEAGSPISRGKNGFLKRYEKSPEYIYENGSNKRQRTVYAQIMAAAQKYGLRILGADSIGLMNTAKGLNAGCAHIAPIPGKIAFLCQNATVSGYVLDLCVRANTGLSHFAGLGSMVDIDFADMIDYLGSLNSVESILMHVEDIPNIRNFMSAARSVSRVKPIIVLKSGRAGALETRDSVYNAAFRRAGILRVSDFQEMFDCAQFIARQKRPRGSRLAVITNSEGIGAMAVDALDSYGIGLSGLDSHTIEQLNQFLPPNWNRENPVTIPVDAPPEIYLKAVQICADSIETDALLLVASPTTALDPGFLSDSLGEYLKTAKCPVFTTWMGGAYGRRLEIAKDVIAYDTPERGVRAFANLCQYVKNIEMLQQIPIRRDRRILIERNVAQGVIGKALEQKEFAVLTDIEAKALVQAYGIRANRTELAVSLDDAISIARDMGYPVMLRICSRDIPRLSDAGGAMLNLNSWEQVEQAFIQITRNARQYSPDVHIMGVLVQPMVTGSDYELMMNVKQDKNFGPVISFGMGGLMTDIIKDTATALPPLDNILARRIIEDTSISRVFKGYRHIKPVDTELVEDMLIRLSRLVTDFPEIEQIEINPVMISNGEPVVTGVKAVVKRSATASPMHLVISSYPFEYETEDETIDHERFFIRPIKPSDAPLMVQHFMSLSPRSVYFRFFTPLKQLSRSMLIRLTQIDYDREIALVALVGEGEEQIMAGVARVIFEPDGKNGEFSVVLADKWHGKGIGASLLKQCLSFAAKKGLERVWGIVLAENRQMLKLARKLGFKAKYIAGSTECEIDINLDDLVKSQGYG